MDIKFPALAVVLAFAPARAHADAMDAMADFLAKRMKNEGVTHLALEPFRYEDGRASSGPALLQNLTAKALAKRGFAIAVKKEEAQSVLTGSLKDKKSGKKPQVELSTVLTQTGGRLIGNWTGLLPKTWNDASTAVCGPPQFFRTGTPPNPAPQAADSVRVVFAQPWWPVQPIGSITWNYCKQGTKVPTLNDALSELKNKAAGNGGRSLLILKNDPHPDNSKVLVIEAEVFY